MSHPSKVHITTGVDDPHAFTCIPLAVRGATLDAKCPTCKGHGQWNREICLISMRSKRSICDHCLGNGWVETGNDAVAIPDIIMTPEGYPKWILRYLPGR